MLLIDLPPGTSDAPLTVLQSLAVDGVVLVTMPQALATMIVRKAANLIHQMKKPILGVVENMSYFVAPDTGKRYDLFGPSYADKVAELARAPVLARLPIDSRLVELADSGRIEEIDDPICAELAARPSRIARRDAEGERDDLTDLMRRFLAGLCGGFAAGYAAFRAYEAYRDVKAPAASMPQDATRYGAYRRAAMLAGIARSTAMNAVLSLAVAGRLPNRFEARPIGAEPPPTFCSAHSPKRCSKRRSPTSRASSPNAATDSANSPDRRGSAIASKQTPSRWRSGRPSCWAWLRPRAVHPARGRCSRRSPSRRCSCSPISSSRCISPRCSTSSSPSKAVSPIVCERWRGATACTKRRFSASI